MLVLPAVDIKDGACVRLRQGKANETTVFAKDPVEAALAWERQGARYLHVIDLDGAFDPSKLPWPGNAREHATCTSLIWTVPSTENPPTRRWLRTSARNCRSPWNLAAAYAAWRLPRPTWRQASHAFS